VNVNVRSYRVVRKLRIQGGGEQEFVVKEGHTDATIATIKCWTIDDLELNSAELRKALDARVKHLEAHGKVFEGVVWEIQILPKSNKWTTVIDLKV
jgi:hypothetical protein